MAKQTINITPQVLDLVLYAGDGISFSLVVTDIDNIPINLTGSMLAQIRLVRTDPGSPITTFAIDLTQAVEGIVRLLLTGVQTQALSDSSPPTEKFVGEWDLEWSPVDAEPITLCQGKVECMPDVSH